jgi:hypothetical protein
MKDMKPKHDMPQEDKWQIEDDARTIEDFYALKNMPDRYNKAIKVLEEKNGTISEALKESNAHKENIGLAKK